MSLLSPLNPPTPAWKDARVWIVGASTGIGAATAKLLLSRGARVALSARPAGKLAEVAGDAVASGRAACRRSAIGQIAMGSRSPQTIVSGDGCCSIAPVQRRSCSRRSST
mgnify:CR=1 FL=1